MISSFRIGFTRYVGGGYDFVVLVETRILLQWVLRLEEVDVVMWHDKNTRLESKTALRNLPY